VSEEVVVKEVVAITGASAGIGAAIARHLAQAGYRLILLARRQEKLERLQREIHEKTLQMPHRAALDVSSKEAVVATFQSVAREVGPIDILINNAGLALGLDAAHRARLEEWEECVAVNIEGLLYCTHAVLPSMVERNRGHIVNLGSVAGSYPYPGGSVYCATKAFVHQFSLSLRADLLGTAVRVSCIEPGLLGGTEFSLTRFRGDVEKAGKVYEGTKPLQPEDIAQIVHFCLSLPPHVNVNTIEVMPVGQAFSSLAVYRD
jgi:3-hydroxy acid dehydrogenase/malonic semialdehyde reductase